MNPMKLMSFVYEIMERDSEWQEIGTDFVKGIEHIVSQNPTVRDALVRLIDATLPKAEAISRTDGKVIGLIRGLRNAVDSIDDTLANG